jgi:hypothetical protein
MHFLCSLQIVWSLHPLEPLIIEHITRMDLQQKPAQIVCYTQCYLQFSLQKQNHLRTSHFCVNLKKETDHSIHT